MSVSELSSKRLPYYCLWIILGLAILALFISLIIPASPKKQDQIISPYVQGYSILSGAVGVIRIIPLAGPAFKSPSSSSIHTVVSPYIEADENNLPITKKSDGY